MAHAISIGLAPPTLTNLKVALGEPMVDVSPSSWDVMRERFWVYKTLAAGLNSASLNEGASRTGPDWTAGHLGGGAWRIQSVRQIGMALGHPILEVESWGWTGNGNTNKIVYEGSGNYAKTGAFDVSKYLFGQFVGGEHWSIKTTFESGAVTISVPVSASIPGMTLTPTKLDGPSGTGLFRHEVQIIKGGLVMHRRYYAYHGTYWV